MTVQMERLRPEQLDAMRDRFPVACLPRDSAIAPTSGKHPI